MGEYTSFLFRLWTDRESGAQHWEARHIQTRQEMTVPDTAFVVRVWLGEELGPFRATIRHLDSGEEFEFQSSERLFEYVRAYLHDTGLQPAGEARSEG